MFRAMIHSVLALTVVFLAGATDAPAARPKARTWNPSDRDAAPYWRAVSPRPAAPRVRVRPWKLSPRQTELLKRIQADRDVDLTWLELGDRTTWAKANKRLANLRLRDAYPHDEYDLFGMDYDALAYIRHHDKLTPEARAGIVSRLRHAGRPWKRNWTHFWKPRDAWSRGCGPGNWYYCEIGILASAARILDDETQTQRALEKLVPCITDYNEHGILGEYNSPTYTPHTLLGLETAAAFTDNEELRLKCQLLAERIRLDIAARFHWPTTLVAGPYSRAYAGDQSGCNNLGKVFFTDFDDADIYLADRSFPQPFSHSQLGLPGTAVIPHECPDYMKHIIRDKPLPYAVESRVAAYDRPTRLERFGETYSYLTEQYAMGSTSTGRGLGHSVDFLMQWVKKRPVKSRKDFNMILTRYMTNEKMPPGPTCTIEEGWFNCFQEENVAIVTYQPAWPTCRKVYSLRADVQFPTLGGMPATVAINDKPVTSYPAEAKRGDVIFIEDGDTFIAIRFLAANPLGPCPEQIQLRRIDHFLILSSYNLLTTPEKARTFTEEELAGIHNGMVVHVGDRKTHKDLAGFRKFIGTARLTQTWDGPRGEISYAVGNRTMACSYSGVMPLMTARRLNGRVVQRALFASPNMRHETTGRIAVGDAQLQTYPGEGAWLVVDPKGRQYVAAHPQNKPVFFRLVTPELDIETRAFRLGKITYTRGSPGTVDIRCVERPDLIRIRPQGAKLRVRLNGHDITDETVLADTYLHNVPRQSRVACPAHIVLDCKTKRSANRGADVQLRNVKFGKVLSWELVNLAWRENRIGIKIKNFPTKKAAVRVGGQSYRNEVLYEDPCGFEAVLPDPRPANALLARCVEYQRRAAGARMLVDALPEVMGKQKDLARRELGRLGGLLKKTVQRLEQSRTFVCTAVPLPVPEGIRITAVDRVLTEAELAALQEGVETGMTYFFGYVYRAAGGTAPATEALRALAPLDLHLWATKDAKGGFRLYSKVTNERYNPTLSGRFVLTLPEGWRLGRSLQRADHNRPTFVGLQPSGAWQLRGWELIPPAGEVARPGPKIVSEVQVACHGVPVTHRVTMVAGRPALRQWQVIGPFANPADAGLGKVHPPEKAIDLAAEYAGAEGKVRWQRHQAGTDMVDLAGLFGPKQNVAAYAVCWIHSPDRRAVRMEVGSDDGIRIWLGEAVVHSVDMGRPVWLGDDVVPITLREGWNRFLVKNTQQGGGWGFLVELYDADGNPMSDLRVALRPKK